MNAINRAVARHKRREGKRKKEKSQFSVLAEDLRKRHISPQHSPVQPLNRAQRIYSQAIKNSILVFGVGPAGTGKTWLAAALAAERLRDNEIERLVITRPAIQAGETLGYLPGNLDEKYEPYFRPVRDALEERLGTGQLEYMIRTKIIEARPMGLLRGSTFKNAWVILDEAQNTTPNQMKMFLTRIGENCKVIVNGDPSQLDITSKSGLIDAIGRLSDIKGVSVVEFKKADVVRSGICREILDRYDDFDVAERYISRAA